MVGSVCFVCGGRRQLIQEVLKFCGGDDDADGIMHCKILRVDGL